MNFVSWKEFYADIDLWEKQLPQFDFICGVPRSGLIPAAYISLKRNLRLLHLSDVIEQPQTAVARAALRFNNPAASIIGGNRLLIVDDSSSAHSATFCELRNKLQNQHVFNISYGAVYRAAPESRVDFYFRQVDMPRFFEWNWARNFMLKHCLLDMDGVICEDWKARPELDHDPEFEQHVSSAKPLYLPLVPVRAIVTSRLERYRNLTATWLVKHGVKYNTLIMHPAKTPADRQAAKDHAKRKAQAYAQDAEACCFIESDIKQAQEIYRLTRRPVLCTDTMSLVR